MVLDRVRSNLENYSKQQKRIVQYLLEHSDEAAFMTADKLAERSGVSEPTVIRFVNRLGYDRYSVFQKELQMDMRHRLSQMDRFEKTEEVTGHSALMQAAIRSMRIDADGIVKTIAALEEDTLSEAVDLFVDARRVYVVAGHSEYGLACYFASTLGWIRENVFLIDESHAPSFDLAATAGKEDIVFALSFPPYPMATIRFFSAITRRGARGITITDSPLSPLAGEGACVFYAQDAKLYYSDNLAPAMSLLSALLGAISARNQKYSAENLKNRQNFWKEIDYYYKENREEEKG